MVALQLNKGVDLIILRKVVDMIQMERIVNLRVIFFLMVHLKNHVIDVFLDRLGMIVQETAALIGAHAIGECHKSHQGFDGPWSPTQTEFTNKLYKMLLNRAWKEKKWDGPRQFEGEETHKLMMLPTDMVILKEPFRRYTELYAED